MIHLHDVSFSYRRNRLLYNCLNLTLKPGSIYGLLGPNGAGKSTLLRLLSGLLYPKAGSVRVGAWQPKDRKPAFLEDLFLVPEEFHLPPVRIGQFVTSNAQFYPRFDTAQMESYLREFGLTDGQKLNELSYGQKKKVLIGFGLATNTALLLMDEPTNGLDIPSKSQFRRLVAGAVDDRRTVVISTHQVRDLETLIDPIVILTGEPGGSMRIGLNATFEEITDRLWFGLRRNWTQAAQFCTTNAPWVATLSSAKTGTMNPVDLIWSGFLTPCKPSRTASPSCFQPP